MALQVIITSPPYADYLEDIVRHPQVCGLRLNTVMPLSTGPLEAITRLQNLGKPLWVDLKSRQLRVVGAAIPPFTEVHLSHDIEVHTPVYAFFADGREQARVVAVDKNRLILENGPQRIIGPGESVNIPHPSLKIRGTLTSTDKAYLNAMKTTGQNKVLLSYVESLSDIEEVLDLLPGAEIILKIESQRGLAFARKYQNTHGHLVAARGDLFVELPRPHKIIQGLKDIITADPGAWVASRIFDSMAFDPVPACAEISDVLYLLSLGYRTFLLGDAICLHPDTLLETLNLLQEIDQDYNKFL